MATPEEPMHDEQHDEEMPPGDKSGVRVAGTFIAVILIVLVVFYVITRIVF